MKRRHLVQAIGGAMALPGLALHAQSWPTRPVKIVVAFAPGGNIAARLVAREPADGYTLFVTTSSLAVNQTSYKDPGFDIARDFAPVALIAASPNVLIDCVFDPAIASPFPAAH